MMLCVNCMKEKCICGQEKYYEIDDDFVDVIVTLNNKGWYTYACCSGHADNGSYIPYISFSKQSQPPKESVEKYNHIKYCFSTQSMYGTIPKKPKDRTKETMIEYMLIARQQFRDLAESLPYRNPDDIRVKRFMHQNEDERQRALRLEMLSYNHNYLNK